MADVVQSVDRALGILELLSKNEQGLYIKDISLELDLHKSTVHRLLGTLIYKGYVKQNESSSKYYVTMKLFQLGSRKVENIDLIEIARPYLNKIAQISGEVVHLVIRDGKYIVYVDKVEGNQTIRMHSKIGRRSYMYCTGVGKAIMSTLQQEEVKKIWEGSRIKKYTKYTIENLSDMEEELGHIKNVGYAIDNEENELGVRCCAVPIIDYKQVSSAALSVSGPTSRMSDEKIKEFSETLITYAAEISKQLGYRG